jgi:hypothetical protein
MVFSESQVKSYIADGGTKCLHCGSPEIEASNQVITEEGIFFDCECTDCLQEWKEHYKLVGISPMKERKLDPTDLA